MSPFRRRLAATAAVLVALVVLQIGLERTRHQLDLTAEHSLTLSTETKRVLARVTHKVKITAALFRTDPDRTPAAALLSRYQRQNRLISYRIVDPGEVPATVIELGIDPAAGGVALQSGDHTEVTGLVTEQDLTAAIARLLRGRAPTLCATTGHGELDTTAHTTDGLGRAAALLVSNGYRVQPLDLLHETSVPSACSALLVARPTAALGPAADAIAAYLRGGGRAVVLADPESNVDLGGVLAPYGMRIERGIVLEGSSDNHLPDDPLSPIVRIYGTLHPITRRLAPSVFPAVEGITVHADPAAGLSVTPLAQTTKDSFLERKPATPHFDEGEDIAGPVTIAAAADRSVLEGSTIQRSRVVVFGDADFATDSAIDQGGNSRLFVQATDWAALEGDLVAVSSNVALLRPLDFTEARARYAQILMAGIVPALFLVAGGLVWAVRRNR